MAAPRRSAVGANRTRRCCSLQVNSNFPATCEGWIALLCTDWGSHSAAQLCVALGCSPTRMGGCGHALQRGSGMSFACQRQRHPTVAAPVQMHASGAHERVRPHALVPAAGVPARRRRGSGRGAAARCALQWMYTHSWAVGTAWVLHGEPTRRGRLRRPRLQRAATGQTSVCQSCCVAGACSIV